MSRRLRDVNLLLRDAFSSCILGCVAVSYADVLAKNVRAARARRGLEQEPLAARMRALGFSAWRRQTVASVEKGTRRLTTEEVFGLALALETRFYALLEPTLEDGMIGLPSGDMMPFRAVHELLHGGSKYTVSWDGDVPSFPTEDPPTWPAAERDYVLPPPALRRSDKPANRPISVEEALEQPVVAAIVTSELGVLVGRRNDGKPPWTFIAGEVEPGESPADAAVREVKEETGLDVQAAEVIGERVHPKTGRTMIYMAAEPTHGTEVFVGDEDELAEVRWVGFTEADELLPGMFEPVREYLAGTIG